MISFSLAVEVFQIIQLKGNQICGCPFHPCISSKCQYILPTTNYSFILRYTCKHSLLFISLQNTMMHNKIHNVPFTNRADIGWLNDGYACGWLLPILPLIHHHMDWVCVLHSTCLDDSKRDNH